jgi:hypothetical protein
MNNNVSTSRSFSSTLPGPLKPAADMAARWTDIDADYDTAADIVIDAHKKDGQTRDLPVMDLRQWGIVPLGDNFGLAPLARHHEPRRLRGNAFANLMGRLGAPADFIKDKLPAPLQLATLNWLMGMQEQPMSATLRLRGDEVAALVSERYAPLDQVELLTGLRDVLLEQGVLDQVRVKSIATGLVDVVRMVFPAEQEAIQVGDISALGIDISTSSFGRSALHVRGIVWRLRCTNGLRVAEKAGGYSFRHVGESQRLRDGLADAVPSALVQARGVMRKWKEAVEVMVTDVAAAIDAMRELSVTERKAVGEELKAETGVAELPEATSLYNIINALTSAAHAATPARRLDMEGLAGDLLLQHGGRA